MTGILYQRACPERSIEPDAEPAPLPSSEIGWARVHASLSGPPLTTDEQLENTEVLGLVSPGSVDVAVAVMSSPSAGATVATLTAAVPPLPIVTVSEPR